MSLMAGFDLVAEISKDALLRLIMKNLTMPKKMGGQLANPPFEVSFPVAAGKAHLIVKKLALDLLSDDRSQSRLLSSSRPQQIFLKHRSR